MKFSKARVDGEIVQVLVNNPNSIEFKMTIKTKGPRDTVASNNCYDWTAQDSTAEWGVPQHI